MPYPYRFNDFRRSGRGQNIIRLTLNGVDSDAIPPKAKQLQLLQNIEKGEEVVFGVPVHL